MKRFSLVVFMLMSFGCLFVVNKPTPTATPRVHLTIKPDDIGIVPMQQRPNILFIMVDDLDAELDTISYMPHLQDSMISQGLTIEEYFITTPLCCPSRATYLRGQFTHNHGVLRNDQPYGGFWEFHRLARESSTVATWMQAAGYRTVMLGKYLNGYPIPEDRNFFPVGWDEWYSPAKGSPYVGYKYTLNENGIQVDYLEDLQGDSMYLTDVLARKAEDFIRRADVDNVPFFVYLSPFAPHSPVKPAPRHEALFPELRAPRTESFNEADVSDKPFGLQFDPLLTEEEIEQLDHEYRFRVLTMQAVDEMILRLIEVVEETGQLENTYIIFTSDNGYHLGQHRLRSGKGTPYEEDIRVPFIIRGPGIEGGSVLRRYITGNVDIAPTLAELAGILPPAHVDGRSLVQLLSGAPPPVAEWRKGYLLEFYGYNTSEDETLIESKPIPVYQGIRTSEYLYVRYAGGFIELYDLIVDPNQMENIASIADQDLLNYFSEWLDELASCSGESCRIADKEPNTR